MVDRLNLPGGLIVHRVRDLVASWYPGKDQSKIKPEQISISIYSLYG
jgi:hypothetical protein